MKKVRERRTWPKFAGAGCLTAAVIEDAATRADAAALRGGTIETAVGRSDRVPVGLTSLIAPIPFLIATIVVNLIWP